MILINYITIKIINLDNNFFSLNYDKSDNVNTIFKILFYSLTNNTYKSKFVMFKESLDSFLNFSREDFIQYFCKIQRTYNALSKFAFIYKYKKSVMSVTQDMGLNDINISNKNVLCIYDKNTRYLFNINDIIKIINTSLTNAFMFFAEPLPIKNPYNNLPFTKANLYNIYFFINFNTNIHADLFDKFFHCDFDLSIFYKKYEHLLREYSIINFINNLTASTLIEEIKKMLLVYNYKNKLNKIKIDVSFPKNILIKIMKPYLVLYFQNCYSLIPIIKRNSSIELNNKLKRLKNHNPLFGRKIIKLGYKIDANFKTKAFIKCYEFNDKHISFNYDNIDFLKNHLTFTEVNSNNYDQFSFNFNVNNISNESEDENLIN